MGINIWVIGDKREELIEAQRKINQTGGMRAICKVSMEAVEQSLRKGQSIQESSGNWADVPSLIIVDFDMAQKDDFQIVSFMKGQNLVAGVPLFFMVSERNPQRDKKCYSLGAIVILLKPFTTEGVQRIERMGWQYEVTKKYEKLLVKQADNLKHQKEIMRLNQELEVRNEILRQIFGRYFSDEILHEVLINPNGAAIGGKKRELTVMMADLRGFTAISESAEPEKVTFVLNYFLQCMLPNILEHKGTVIEYLGDAILTVFGAPMEMENQVENAVAAAIKMQNQMGRVNDYCKENQFPMLEMGIAIHRGEAFVGNVGSDQMMRYNVIGSVVNECSRIESFSLGGQVLLSQDALNCSKVLVEVASKREILAKGMHRPIMVCEVTGVAGEYQCELENKKDSFLLAINDWVIFNMYPVEGKIVRDECICAKVMEFSKRRAVVALMESEEQDEIFVNMDVEIFASGQDGKALFTRVYAKVMENDAQKIVLHFTHVNGGFNQFAERVMRGKEKLYDE